MSLSKTLYTLAQPRKTHSYITEQLYKCVSATDKNMFITQKVNMTS